jgi:multiple sugar transport system ATP-binding protein
VGATGLATVSLVELLGPRAIVSLNVGGDTLTSVVEAANLTGITPGSRVSLAVRPGSAHLFDSVTGERVVD